jgi:peroxiredoxin
MKFVRVVSFFIVVFAFSTIAFGQKTKMMAEDFSAVNMNGQTVNMDSLKGKVVVLTFWSTRCAICHTEIPKLNRLAENYKGRDVVFLGLTTDNPAKVESYLAKTRFNFNILPNSFGVLLKYAQRDGAGNINMGYPAHFLVNQNGEIEFKTNGFDKTNQLNSGISRLLMSRQAKAE